MSEPGDPGRDPRAPIAAVPPGWTLEPLARLARSKGHYGSSAPAQPYDAALPRYVRITDIDDSGRLRADSLASIAAHLAEPHLLRAGDLLFARSGATAGKTYLYDPGDGPCAHGGYLVRFSLAEERCEPWFVAHWTQSEACRRWLRGTLRQAAQANVNAAELAALPVPSPPRDEQRAIALVLSWCDTIIDRTERIVDQLARVLAAMVADLLSCGVTADGRVRDPGAEPGAFHDTPLGLLPRGWRVRPVAELLASVAPAMRSGPFGSELRKSELAPEGVPLLGIDNVGRGEFVPVYRRFVRPGKFEELRRYAVRPGDVMITIMGTVGRSCLVPDGVQALSSKHVWTLTFDRARYLPLLASMQFNHAPWVHAHFGREGQGGTMTAIRSHTLRTTLLPVPPPEEQERIARALRMVRARLRAERALLAKRVRLREALREDLITGRVRFADGAGVTATITASGQGGPGASAVTHGPGARPRPARAPGT